LITSTALVSLNNISKSFGATKAVKDASISFSTGQIIGLVGENGAGKSTLAKIIAGIYSSDSGTISLDGSIVNFKSPFESMNIAPIIDSKMSPRTLGGEKYSSSFWDGSDPA
jgi:ABC-type sugar transport system ATPase subunit